MAGVDNYLSHAGELYDISRPNDERFANTKPGAADYKPMLYPGGWTRLDADRANQKALDTEPLARSYSGGIYPRLSSNHFQSARATGCSPILRG